MPFKHIFDTQEAAPEYLRSHLVEQEGKWVFEGETAAEVGNLKATVKKERDGRTKFEADLKRYERFKPLAEADDEEREQFFQAWEKRNDPPDDKGTKGGKTDADTKQQFEMKDRLHQKEVKRLTDENGQLKTDLGKAQAELREFKLWTPLREVAIKNGLNAEDWDLARLDLSAQGRFGFDDDGKIVVMEEGSPSHVTAEKFFKDVYSDQRRKFYKASSAGGSGASKTTGGKPGVDLSKMSPGERLKYARENNIKE